MFKKMFKTKNIVQKLKNVNEEKKGMIQGVVDLADTQVREVMIPRIDVDFVSIDTEHKDLLEFIVGSGHSRFPVYADSVDNVVGVVYVKDMLRIISKGDQVRLAEIIKKPFFVPESKRIDSLLREFKRRHIHIAIAIDEYGGISGIWLCDSRVDLEDLGEKIGCDELPIDDFETLGGFVFDLFGKIPVKFEKSTWKGYDFIVHDVEGHKVNTIKIIKHKN